MKRCYKKKRKFYDNRCTHNTNKLSESYNFKFYRFTWLPGTSLSSKSSKKLKLISNNSASNNMKVVLIALIEMMVTTASKQFVMIMTKKFYIIPVLIIRTITKMFLTDQIFMQRKILHIIYY